MFSLKKINLFPDRKKYNIPLKEYPPFIFLIMGVLIIGIILLSYFIGSRYLSSEYVVFVVVIITIVLFVLDYIIVNSFQHLAEANLMKSEFMNIVSHELKTPLTNLKWTIEMAMAEKNLEKSVGYFDVINTQCRRMLKLINNMLMASRIEQGRWALKKEKTDIKEIVEKNIEKFKPVARSNNIGIRLHKEGMLKLETDSQGVTQVIENLLDNAINYSKPGTTVEVILSRKRNKIRFAVKDKGVGIPREEQRNIFRKFFRSSNVLRYQTQGLGLSLFIVKEIIQKLRGKVGFASKEGQGSTFWFELPIK